MKPCIIAFSNQKGGVGKTTTAREIGLCLASLGHRVLLIDTDPQANLSRSLSEYVPAGLYEALSGETFLLPEVQPNLFLLAGCSRLALLEKSLVGEMDAYIRIRDLLCRETFRDFDFIFIDSPPSLGVLTINSLTAAHYLVVPMHPSLYSMQGTNDLMATVSKVKKNLNSSLTLLGVILNAFDSIPVITRKIKDEIQESFQDKLFHTILSKSIRIEEAIAAGVGVTRFKSKTADEIKALSEEVLKRLKG